MSIYPAPKLRDGVLNTVFNSADYVRDLGGGGLSLAQIVVETDALYLKNSGVVVSSANTTFNGTLSATSFDTATITATGLCSAGSLKATTSVESGTITATGLCSADSLKATTSLDTATITATGLCSAGSLKATTSLDTATITASGLCSAGSLKATTSLDTATITATGLCTANSLKATTSLEAGTITAPLATIDTLTVSTLKAKNSSDTLTAEFWRTDQVYSFSNGMVYSLISDATAVNSVSFINIPTTINQSYIFTFIIQPSVANSPFYIKSNTNTIKINNVSIPLYGLQNVSLPANYTYLVQQISIIYNLYATDPKFIALTSISAY